MRIGEQAGNPLVELFVSTEKAGIDYPTGLESFLKPGAGVWTIERLTADSIAGLADAAVETILHCDDPQFLHVKDPFLYEVVIGELGNEETVLGFLHPSRFRGPVPTPATSTSGGRCRLWAARLHVLPRGATWDVAMSRATAMLRVAPPGRRALRR